ncbi:hypothetical protein TNCV_212681 [Trichonephila clavipes]|nr:hypothetical protein TNCV_212681 [Trichonephila clavipes]
MGVPSIEERNTTTCCLSPKIYQAPEDEMDSLGFPRKSTDEDFIMANVRLQKVNINTGNKHMGLLSIDDFAGSDV